MAKASLNVDEVLQKLAAESVKRGDNLRVAVRDLTLKGLQARELSLKQIKQVVRSVTSGVNLGAATGKVDVEGTLAAALAGMDDAVLKAVEASRMALDRLFGQGADFENSRLKKSLADLERMEDEFLKTVRKAAGGATDKVREQWSSLIKDTRLAGTGTGEQVAANIEGYARRMQDQLRANREATLKAAHLLSQNFATLASGILIGLSEGVRGQAAPAGVPPGAATPAKPAPKKAAKPAAKKTAKPAPKRPAGKLAAKKARAAKPAARRRAA